MDVRASRWARLLGCAFLMICLAGASNAFAQGGQTATLSGTVVDNVGVVPGATVTISSTSTSVPRTVVTNEQGVFRFVSIPPARYTLKVHMEGFKEIDLAEFPLSAGETRDLNKLTLSAGGVQETVNVTAEVTPVQTTSSALQKNLTSDMLTTVQVKGRDIFGMLKILPGIMDASNSRDFAAWNSGRSLAINGGNSLNKNTTIDGVPVGEEGGNGTTYITPNIDAVAEVNVISSGYTAENGRMASGQVAMVTKSGTNEFKGSSWYNGRRDFMNKNDYLRIKAGNAKPFFAVDIMGFSFGGPVIIPKLINSRTSNKKVFFFASEEYTKDIRPTNVQYTALPTALERVGDFSQTFYCSSTANPCTRDAAGTLVTPGSTTRLNLINPYSSRGVNDFFCAAGTGGASGVACAGTTTNTGIMNSKYFNSMGVSMLKLMPLPNGVPNTANNAAWTSNNGSDTLPEHIRKNLVLRVDTVLSQKTRFSIRGLFDRDDSTVFNDIMPGVGSIDNVFPGNLLSSTITQVLRPTVVNEITMGFAQNHWGFIRKPGKLEATDYTSWWRDSIGIDPPRLAPFGAYRNPPVLDANDHTDQYPYFPNVTVGGGNAANNGYIRPAGSSAPVPRWNQNYRYTFQDDLTVVKGRHSFKFGFFTERDSKTEPGSADYAGSYNFSHTGNNPFSASNGYANMLIGEFASYVERDRRIDAEIRHWLTEGYVQDTWRMTPRLTMDYGIRLSHNGSLYESREFNSAFNPSLYTTANEARLFTPFCQSGQAGNATCGTIRAKHPITGAVVAQAFTGTAVPGVGSVTNGMFAGGLSGKRAGEYDSLQPVSWGPRVGFAWDVFGDGKTAVRGATGVFYNLFNRSNYGFNGGPLTSIVRNVTYGNINDIDDFVASGNLAVSPAGIKVPLAMFDNSWLSGNMIKPTELQAERHYQGNLAVQRDIGFNTTVEVAWVGNYGRHYWQAKNVNNIPINSYASVANLFNNTGIDSQFIRRNYKGVGSISYGTTDELGLNYNSMQVSAQRRLSHGLQMGLAYTLAKGEGQRGWNFLTEELYGKAGLKEVYFGPQTTSDQGQERRHVLVLNYSYQIPTLNLPVLKYVLAGWEASGVATFVTGDPLNPTCNAAGTTAAQVTIRGIANTDPSLSGVGARCEWQPGNAILSGYDTDPVLTATGVASLHEDTVHFNPYAFQRPLPLGTTFNVDGVLGANPVGNIGNTKWGTLRNPNWSNWDFTLARRVPIKIGRGGNARIQIQFYNMFNQIEWNEMNVTMSYRAATATGALGADNSSANTGKYTGVRNPFNGSVTVRFDY